jgi:NitT/TauT family transport system substrate-binding protein
MRSSARLAAQEIGMERLKLALLLGLALVAQQAAAATKIVIGTVPNIGDGPLICAMERGYFREQDIEVDIVPFKTASEMTPLIVRGDLAMMGGGVSVSFFNSVAQGMPLRYFVNRAQAPVWHSVILRKELAGKVKGVKDLKGLRIATSAAGGLAEYELGKTLETAGLSLDDVETKHLSMPQTVIAIQTGAVDAGVFVPPFDAAAIQSGGSHLLFADELVTPRMEVSGLIYNADWAAKNAATLDRFTVAYIRGVRCFVEASKEGPVREEMVDGFVKYSPIKDRSNFSQMKWSGINPDGQVEVDSLMDMQDFYMRRGYLTKKLPRESLFDPGPVERALKILGVQKK